MLVFTANVSKSYNIMHPSSEADASSKSLGLYAKSVYVESVVVVQRVLLCRECCCVESVVV